MQCINKKFTATLYCNIYGVPSRACLLTIRNLGLDIDLRYVDLSKGEQNTPEFIKINPLHQVPVLHVAEEKLQSSYILESRSIMMYLATVAKSSFYPVNDLNKRAVVDSRLFFDATTAHPAVRSFTHQILRVGVKKIPSEIRENVKTLLHTLEQFLSQSEWFAGDELTLADFALLASVESIKCWGANLADYPKLNAWYEKCRPLPGFTENHEGARKLAEKMAKMLSEPLWLIFDICSDNMGENILYHNIHSPPSRMCYIMARNLPDFDLEIRDLDIMKGEQNSPEFLQLNPMHQVPTLIHDGFVVTEARSIMMYLATITKSPLYPIDDLKQKTLIDSRLYFDATNCSLAVKNFAFPILRKGMKTVPEITRDGIKAVLENVNNLLQPTKYFAGNKLTIADFSLLANIATIKHLGVDFSPYINLNSWYKRCESIPGFIENQQGSKMLAEKLAKCLNEPLWQN